MDKISIFSLWLAAMCSHVPNKSEMMVKYYGHYSNVSRGKRKKADNDDRIPYFLEPELSDKAFRTGYIVRLVHIANTTGFFQ